MKESMREAFVRSAKITLCSGDPGPYPPGTYHGGYYRAEIVHGIIHCCGDDRCASGFHPVCDVASSATPGVRWIECVPDGDEDSRVIHIILALGAGLGAAWLGTRWAEAKSLPGWTGPVLGVLTALVVLWLMWPRRKSR
jgi:hypothetical protein